MAWASVGLAGSTGNATANSTILTITLNGQAGSGANVSDVLVFTIAVQNASSNPNVDEGAVLSVSDNGTNTKNVWLKAREVTAQAAGAVGGQGGAVCSVWYTHVDTALTTGNTVSAIFGSSASRDAQAGIVWRFTNGSGNAMVADSTFVTAATSLLGTLDITTINQEHLRFRAIGAKTTITSLTTTSGWTTIGNARASATVALGALGEFRIVSAATAASAPQLSAATTQASILIAFREDTPMGQIVL